MKMIVANWKSNKSLAEAEEWFVGLRRGVEQKPVEDRQAIVCPPYPFLSLASKQVEGLANVALGVQDVSPFPPGKYTGAISARLLKDFAVRYTIVGHSERRRYFHESNQDVANKVEQALDAGVTPVVCVEEKEIDGQAGILDKSVWKRVIVAYEPLEAIGTGQGQDIAMVKPVVEEIRRQFGEVPVIYGGSVSQGNISEYLLVTDGVLVGSASLDVEEFLGLVNC